MSPREELEELFRAALGAVEGGRGVERALRDQGLADVPAAWTVLAAGKAAAAMCEGALRVLGARVVEGFAVSRDEPERPLGPIECVRAGHPLPDARSQAAGERALAMAAGVDPAGRILVLLSGGASALWVAPATGVSLEDKRRLTAALLRSGVTIGQLNAVRKHLSRIKGGGLLRAARAPIWTLALSDVAGDPPEVIGSGPTVADSSTYQEAIDVIARAGLQDVAPACWQHLQAHARIAPDASAPGIRVKSLYRIVGSLERALQAAVGAARARGLRVRSLGAGMAGEARDLAAGLVREAARARRDGVDLVVAGGEPTVRVTGPGRGGRAQELALAFALAAGDLAGFTALFAGTDGSDGPTDAAGAVVDARSIAAARAAGVDAREALARNDSYRFHRAAGGLFVTGPTGTNVTDLALIRLDRDASA